MDSVSIQRQQDGRGFRRRLGLAAVILGLMCAPLRALDPGRAISQYVHAAYSPREGLPVASLSNMAQDRDGCLWIGTMEGLVRFDGFTFTVFDRSNTPGLPQSEVRQLLVDDAGTLWIGLAGGGLVRYDGHRFEPAGLAGAIILDIRRLGRDELLVGSNQGGFRVRAGRLEPMRLSLDPAAFEGFAMAEGRRGEIWIGANGDRCEVVRLDPDGRETRFRETEDGPIPTISCMREDPLGRFWLCTRDRVYRFEGGRFVRAFRGNRLENLWIGNILTDRDGALWLAAGVDQPGLYRYSKGAVSFFGKADGLFGERVTGLCEDREGNLWVSTWDGGLNRFSDGAFTTWTVREGLSHDSVPTVIQDAAGDIWAGTVLGGANRLDRHGWRAWPVGGGLRSERVYALAAGPDGAVYAGGIGGVAVFRGGRFERYRPFPELGPKGVHSLYLDAQNRLWAGGPGLFSPAGEGFQNHPEVGAPVFAIHRDRRGRFWAGSILGLFASADGRAWERRRIGLPAPREVIFSICEDGRGDLWFGSLDGGIARYRGGRFEVFTVRDGLHSDSGNAILADGQERLWIGGNKGIAVTPLDEFDEYKAGRRARLSYRLFDQDDGLKSNEISGGSSPTACKDRQGRLWFGTVRGLAMVDPARVGRLPAVSTVLLQRVAVDGAARAPAERLEIPPGPRRLEIEYTAIHLQAPGRLRFRYRLEGFDPEWKAAGQNRRVEYLAIPPGRYRFQVAAAVAGGPWTASVPVAIQVAPYFWQTGWFYGAAGALLVLLGLAAGWWRRRRLERRGRVLAGLVAERTRELQAEQERSARALLEREEARRELETKQELDRLVDFGRAVAGVLDPEEIFLRLEQALRARWGDTWRLIAAAREGRDPLIRESGPGSGLPLDGEALRKIWMEAFPGHAAGEQPPKEMDTPDRRPVPDLLGERGAAALAILARGRTPFGLVAVGAPGGQAGYSERELAHLEALAGQAALALEGAWQAQEALRWQGVSEARSEWGRLDLSERLIFAAVVRYSFEGPPSEERIVEALAGLLPGTRAGQPERIRSGIARLVERGILSRDGAGGLCGERERWLLLPEIRLPLAEIARETVGRIGAYQILERLGAGGMGEVFRAANVHDGSEAAVKILFAHETADPEARRRIEREGRIVAAISHPNIVRLLERGEHDGRLYLAMELLAGETLAARLRREGAWPLSRVARGGRQLASALGELHRHGVVHRDVNSANIMCADHGRLVLLDFGLAKVLQGSLLTRSQTVLGTLPYMSPEQLRGEETDPKSDWWSFGVVLHEMATGELPWDGEGTIQVALSILKDSGSALRRLSGRVPPGLERLVGDLLRPSRTERLGDAAQVLDRLQHIEPVCPDGVK